MADSSKYSLIPPEWRGHAVKLAELWRLTKANHVAVCTLFHPIGWEARCDVDGDIRQTKSGRELAPLLDESDTWKAALVAAHLVRPGNRSFRYHRIGTSFLSLSCSCPASSSIQPTAVGWQCRGNGSSSFALQE